jgi:hypothetical protein
MAERKTIDIDIIIPDHRELQIEADASFRKALEVTNRELEKQGLYITHTFAESQVLRLKPVLRPKACAACLIR